MKKIMWNWGWSIALAYSLFAIATTSFVFFAFSHNVELISDDYYEQEIQYQDRIEETQRAESLGNSVNISIENNIMTFTAPKEHAGSSGIATFYYPASINDDVVMNFILSDRGIADFNIAALKKGRRYVKMSWMYNGKRFHKEITVDL